MCPYSTTSVGNLNRHIAIHSGDRPFKCTFCHKQFILKQHLKNHMSVHLGYQFPCEICGKKFSRRDSVKYHRYLKHFIK